ncbi:hypothetical protein PG999_006702 [Apiospora kogelbergensis]|uniref:Uncharacterized protein n=1 Tax=Apiospora kogelbergensis TaxID=1337665 RepID=A0AAW0QW75_9PEZI
MERSWGFWLNPVRALWASGRQAVCLDGAEAVSNMDDLVKLSLDLRHLVPAEQGGKSMEGRHLKTGLDLVHGFAM